MCSRGCLWPVFLLLGPGIFWFTLGGPVCPQCGHRGAWLLLPSKAFASRCVLEDPFVSGAPH